jgi:two-component system sensor histidine kinase ChvG
MAATSRLRGVSWNLFHSFSLKLLLLALILLTVPLILYWQFERAETQQFALLRGAAGNRGRIVAAMLLPHFAGFTNESPEQLRKALAAAAIDNTEVKVLVRLAGAAPDDFIYVASAPSFPAAYLERERQGLLQSGVLQSLETTCDTTAKLALHFVNPAGQQEVLTSIAPEHVNGNCWVVVTSQKASDYASEPINQSFWTNPAMRTAAAIYALSAVLVVWLFAHLWRNVSRFRAVARRIRMREAGAVSFSDLNTIPELARVAEDFDSLVIALLGSQEVIRQTAEENAHALKAPLAVIAQSVEPLRRALAPSDTTAQRGLYLIERSVSKLDSLVTFARDLEKVVADVVYPERYIFDLSGFLARMLGDYDVLLASQDKRLEISIFEGVSAYADEDMLEAVIENLMENALSFTLRGGVIEVGLSRNREFAQIRVADRGPGVDPADLPHIFDRYVSRRQQVGRDQAAPSAVLAHQGLGLWVVKRNVEGLGGTVSGHNREGGGFEILVELRAGS